MKPVYGAILVALLLILAAPSGLDSCAIAPPAAVFVAHKRPADREAFLAGRVPVLQRSYSGPDLIAAFRVLSGKPLTEAEVASLYPAPESEHAYSAPEPVAQPWVQFRENVPGVLPLARLEPYRTISTNGGMQTFLNCQRDAFLRAVDTLDELMTKWGPEDARTTEWLKAQDQVFANCAGPSDSIPAEPTAGMDKLLAAHRRYQIAAANFYAGHYREARERFRHIAQEADSPWRGIAPYLEARALLRAGLVDGDQAGFQEGKAAVQALLDDSSREEWHEPGLDLLHLWQIRVEPIKRLGELGESLQHARDADVTQEVIDFLYLVELHSSKIRTMTDAGESELAAWVIALSSKAGDKASASMAWWRKRQSPAWLVAALMNADDSDSAELVRAARRVAPGSPAYESAGYYAIVREIRASRWTEARQWADRMLAGKLSRSSRNLLLEKRMALAQNWNEFLRFAPRLPEPLFVDFDDKEKPWDRDPQPGGPFFLQDAQLTLNLRTPIALWLDATRNPLTPRPLQLRLAFSGWLRAVMLDRYAEARQFLQRAIELNAGNAAAAHDFLAAKDGEAAHFAAIRLVLRAPSICPSAPYPGLTATDLSQKHTMLVSGWYRSSCWGDYRRVASNDSVPFLTAEQLAAGNKESARVYGQQPWEATVLLRETVGWALKHPGDPTVPEALHDAVAASRYRGTDTATGTYSKRAFDLLHRHYSNSPWTARTPYWYK